MANICLVPLDQLHGKVIELRKVVARVRDLPRLKAQPAHHLEDTFKVSPFLLLWVGIVVSEITFAVVVRGITKVDKDGFGVSDVEVTVGLWWKTRPDLSTSRLEVRLSKMWVNLGVPSWLVECTEKAFVEHCALYDGLRYDL